MVSLRSSILCFTRSSFSLRSMEVLSLLRGLAEDPERWVLLVTCVCTVLSWIHSDFISISSKTFIGCSWLVTFLMSLEHLQTSRQRNRIKPKGRTQKVLFAKAMFALFGIGFWLVHGVCVRSFAGHSLRLQPCQWLGEKLHVPWHFLDLTHYTAILGTSGICLEKRCRTVWCFECMSLQGSRGATLSYA